MRVLIGCERSGIVREAFRARGHDAYSCDTAESEHPSPYHLLGDVRKWLTEQAVLRQLGWSRWDLGIFFPDCTHLAVSGAWKFKEKSLLQADALDFVRLLLNADISKIALENPVGVISTRIRKPDQIIQPYQFGHDASKKTCLWLKNLLPLVPTRVVRASHPGNNSRMVWGNQTPGGQNKLGPSPTRAIDRARTYQGIANAMAQQWGGDLLHPRTTEELSE